MKFLFVSGKFEELYQNLTKISNNLRTFNVYKKDELPDRWHIKNTSRLNGKLYILAKPGYAFWYNLYEYILNSTSKFNVFKGLFHIRKFCPYGFHMAHMKVYATFTWEGRQHFSILWISVRFLKRRLFIRLPPVVKVTRCWFSKKKDVVINIKTLMSTMECRLILWDRSQNLYNDRNGTKNSWKEVSNN